MNQVWIVLRREYLERVKTKGFVLSTVAIPLLMVAMIGVSGFLAVQSERSERRLGLVDLTGRLGDEVARRLDSLGYQIEVASAGTPLAELDQQVLDEELEAYLVLDELTLLEGVFAYRGTEGPGTTRSATMRSQVVESALLLQLATTAGAEGVRSLVRGGRLQFESVVEEAGGEEAEVARVRGIVSGAAGAILLYMTMLLYGQYVLRAVLDEKRNRVVEVVISSITPWRLMLGKILGVGSMGLTQMGIWLGSAALLSVFAVPVIASMASVPELENLSQYLPGPGALALLGAYFLIGYFLYASLFAAVGAMCSTEEDAQQAQFPIIMLLVIPFILQMASIDGGGFAWMEWVALFPYFSPVMMFPRAVAGTVPWWMAALSLVLMALALVGTAWLAGRIYRVGILMQGKRPTLPELMRWVRSA